MTFGAALLSVLALIQNNARADCWADCDSDYYSCVGAYEERSCATERSICTQRCALPQQYGAIAHSIEMDAYGYSFDHATRVSAERRALSECGARADDCEVVLWFWNACGALAQDEGGAYGVAWGTTTGDAQAGALSACEENGGTACAVVETVCSGG